MYRNNMKTEYKDPRCKEGEHEWDKLVPEQSPESSRALHCKICRIWRFVSND